MGKKVADRVDVLLERARYVLKKELGADYDAYIGSWSDGVHRRYMLIVTKGGNVVRDIPQNCIPLRELERLVDGMVVLHALREGGQHG